MDEKFLGQGIKFPLQVNRATGKIVMSKESESIKESIYLILKTQKSERFGRYDFGSRLSDYAFMDLTTTWITVMTNEIREDILSQEPRISDVNISVDSQSSKDSLLVYIEYNIIAENKKENLVFPYYRNSENKQREREL